MKKVMVSGIFSNPKRKKNKNKVTKWEKACKNMKFVELS